MPALDTISIAILLGSLLVLAGILSSLIALRFGAPLLLVFLILGMLAGEGGPGGIKFNDVATTYTVGSIALALILFDGGLRTRFASFRSVLAPALTLATAGVLITALLTAPIAKLVLGLSWTQSLLVGAVVASTDAAAVFFLINARGLRLRPRVRATLEVESGTNDPFAVFLTLLLVQVLAVGHQSFGHALLTLAARRRRSAASSAMPAAGSSPTCSTGSTCRRACTRPSPRSPRWWCSPSPMPCTPPASSPSISPAWCSATGRRARIIRWWCFSTPPPGWRRSRCSCCSACWSGRSA